MSQCTALRYETTILYDILNNGKMTADKKMKGEEYRLFNEI